MSVFGDLRSVIHSDKKDHEKWAVIRDNLLYDFCEDELEDLVLPYDGQWP